MRNIRAEVGKICSPLEVCPLAEGPVARMPLALESNRNCLAEARDTGYGIWDVGYGIRDTGY